MGGPGSSKAMEPDVYVELVKACETSGNTEVTILVGDDDSATIKKSETVKHSVEKWSDVVHAKRSFGSHLYSIQGKHKGNLSAKTIDYLVKCFGYAVKQNKNDPDGLKKNLDSIVSTTLR